MNRGELRHRILLRLKKYKGTLEEDFDNSIELINGILEEGHKAWARETLCLETSSSSLTHDSTAGAFDLPTDFIKAKYLEWETDNNEITRIQPTSMDYMKQRRNYWKDVSDDTAAEVTPDYYAIFNDQLYLDSTTDSSPTLYYFKYDTAFSLDSSSPGYKEEFHKYLIDYTLYELTGDGEALARWKLGLIDYRRTQYKKEPVRSRYIGL
jgi:hypothetical protein